MDKNTIWAFILILAVFWLSSELLWKKNVVVEKPGVTAESGVKEAVAGVSEVKQPVAESASSSSTPAVVIPEEDYESDIALNESIILENQKIRISFTNQGAGINSIQLKNYYLQDKESIVELVRENGRLMTLDYADVTGNLLSGVPVIYNWEKPDQSSVIFTGTGSFGTIRKTFILGDSYQMEMDLAVTSNQSQFDYVFKFDDGIADTERYLKRKKQNYQLIFDLDNKVERLTLQKLGKNQELNGKIDWAAVRSKFFVIGIIKDELSSLYHVFAYDNNDSPAFRMYGRSTRSELNSHYSIYLGPVLAGEMNAMGRGFESAYYAGNGIFFGQGFIKPISRFFSWIFTQFHRVIPSFGLCLILFSILIKLLLYPLTHKSFESSTKLQKVQPQVTALREKYKSDPQKMNQEMQKIYKEHGVSPLGGCLPMLLQMPIFFALYPVIRYSIDLRQAGFLWLNDLSEPDPYLILPILMAVFMFLQQYMMQPKKEALAEMSDQQKAQMQSQKMMMYMMPAMMFFLFKSFPSGLVLYWTVFNVMSMFQQRVIRRKFS
ncbi:MAG: membrane protein insertase YidC [Candidatus Cloacimonetes bacterium]|nr:membrane protein insertase YidC [Candidatus Cloacimonadota bacterium]